MPIQVSPWQDRGDILSFCRANPDEDRLALVCHDIMATTVFLTIFHQLEGAASAFAYLHSRSIVHGNVRCVGDV